MEYILLLIGFLLLVKGADYFVEGASGIARFFKIPSLIIGLTIVAFGTSAPEAAVSISAAINGNNGIAIGNVLGSNIFNIGFILGLAAMIYPLKVDISTIKKEIPLTLVGAVLLFVFAWDSVLGSSKVWIISRNEGIAFLILFIIFIYYILESVSMSRETLKAEESLPHKNLNIKSSSFFTVAGLIGVIVGGRLVVSSASSIATSLGMSQTLIGLTIVAVGTSLPELVTCIIAARKKESDIVVGNIVGSNIFNALFVIGASSVLHPIPVDPNLFFDLILNIILTIALLVFSVTGRKLIKFEGFVLFSLYAVYTGYLIFMNM